MPWGSSWAWPGAMSPACVIVERSAIPHCGRLPAFLEQANTLSGFQLDVPQGQGIFGRPRMKHKMQKRHSAGRTLRGFEALSECVGANLALLCVLFSCNTFAQEARLLRLGHFPNLTHAQALYARANGEFEKAIGLPLQWISFNAGPSAIEALFTDAVDMTFVGPNPAINGYIKSKGAKFVIIAGAASGGAGLVVRKDSGIESEKDFNDKMVATPQLGNTQDLAARIWFAKKGYRLKEKGGRLSL